jgi:hypothetical protein
MDGRYVHLLIQSIDGTVIASARVEIKSIEALSDSAALYRATGEIHGKDRRDWSVWRGKSPRVLGHS